MALAKITAKGQVTILLAIRQRLGIRPGDEIEFQETGNGILVTKCVAASPYRYVCRLPEKEAWSAARPYCRLTKLASPKASNACSGLRLPCQNTTLIRREQ